VAAKVATTARRRAIELNAETDFVSKNATFQNAAREVATVALGVDGDVDALNAAKTSKGESVSDMVTNLIATIGENMRVRRSARLSVPQGAVAVYIHNKEADDVGKMGVLVALEGAGDASVLRGVGKRIALHVAGTPTPPLALTTSELDPTVVEKEREIQTQMAMESGKPGDRREDGRGPDPQVDGGGRPPEAAVRDEPGPDRRATGRRDRQDPRLAGDGEGLRALRPGRGRGEEVGRLRGRSGIDDRQGLRPAY
jgi:hypothetical protein